MARLPFLGYRILFGVLFMMFFNIVNKLLQMHQNSGFFILLFLLGYAFSIFIDVYLMIGRLHDLNRSGWLSLLASAPILAIFMAIPLMLIGYIKTVEPNAEVFEYIVIIIIISVIWFFMTVYLHCFKGTDGDNDFGEQP